MDTRESLTVRTVSALQRLADLEARGRTVSGPKAGVLKTALRELEGSLEELRTATEQLNELMDELAGARSSSARLEAQRVEFREAVPMPCVLTDAAGLITETNVRAGDLLNVAPRHLAGKPLSLYMANRDEFFALVSRLKFAEHSPAATLPVRPRERKPRLMEITVTRLQVADRLCWFFKEPPSAG